MDRLHSGIAYRLAPFLVALPLFCSAPMAHSFGDEYWITYAADDFPENQGWARIHGDQPAERWIDDGVFVSDGRNDLSVYDFYEKTFDSNLDPGEGEIFIMRWRLKVTEEDGPTYDPAIGVTSNEVSPDVFYRAAFGYTTNTVRSAFERDKRVSFEPGVFHTYELSSSDMRSYELYVDGELSLSGSFREVYGPTRVSWGDAVEGATSYQEWDYVRFGVVPEPGGFIITVVAASIGRAARGRIVSDRSIP